MSVPQKLVSALTDVFIVNLGLDPGNHTSAWRIGTGILKQLACIPSDILLGKRAKERYKANKD